MESDDVMQSKPPLILASQSPRRAQLLDEAGLVFECCPPPFADPDQPPRHLCGDEAEAYAVSLAQQKACSLAGSRLEGPMPPGAVLPGATLPGATLPGVTLPGVILAADTICVDSAGRLVGKPRDRAHARDMLGSFIDAEHRVLTGVALLVPSASGGADLRSFADAALVRFGSVSAEQLDSYLGTGAWRGKAGGYNLSDRQRAGWPIEVQGDPTTVVGLPMRRLIPMLQAAV